MTGIAVDIRPWLMPSTARGIIEDIRLRHAWNEVPAEVWESEGAVLNMLEVMGNNYPLTTGISWDVALQHFVKPDFAMRAIEIVGNHAITLMATAYEVIGDASCFLDWKCLHMLTRRFSDDGGLADWMQQKDLWNSPCMPMRPMDVRLVSDITDSDVRFWCRVELNLCDEDHLEIARDGIRRDPHALLFMRFADLKAHMKAEWGLKRADLDAAWQDEQHQTYIRMRRQEIWRGLYQMAVETDSTLADLLVAPE